MKQARGLFCCLFLGAAALSAVSAGAQKPSPPAAPASIPAPGLEPRLRDRVMAVVDEDPILASEVERVVALGLAERKPGESDTVFRRRILDGLVEQRLRFHEIDRYGFEQVPVDMIEKNVAVIRARFPNEEAFRKALRDLGLTQQALRQLVARQLLVLTHVEEQLGPRVFVGLDDITQYYRTTYTQEMQRQKLPVQPLDDVREQIRTILKEDRLNKELEKWTEELRRKADIHIYFDKPPGDLPPVIKRIEKKGSP
jgi:DNA-binding MarR family transcriptional regulator